MSIFISGFLFGALATMLVVLIVILVNNKLNLKPSKSKTKVKYIRKGLYSGEFTRSNQDGSHEEEYIVSAEIGEVERTKKKSKIEVIELRTSIYSDEANKNQIIDIIEGWRDSDDKEIEWFEKHPGDERAEKIDDLLKADKN